MTTRLPARWPDPTLIYLDHAATTPRCAGPRRPLATGSTFSATRPAATASARPPMTRSCRAREHVAALIGARRGDRVHRWRLGGHQPCLAGTFAARGSEATWSPRLWSTPPSSSARPRVERRGRRRHRSWRRALRTCRRRHASPRPSGLTPCWWRSCTPTMRPARSNRSPRSPTGAPRTRHADPRRRRADRGQAPHRRAAADLVSISAHKFGGPKGSARSAAVDGTPWNRLVYGGGQESGRRAGTENLAGVFGMAAAAAAARSACPRQRARRRPPAPAHELLETLATSVVCCQRRRCGHGRDDLGVLRRDPR